MTERMRTLSLELPESVLLRLIGYAEDDHDGDVYACAVWILTDYAPPVEIEDDE